MIPESRDELHALAGEYVLGVLDPAEAGEVAAALATNAALRTAVAFWEEALHPLSTLAPPAEPPSGLWDTIAARLDDKKSPPAAPSRFWSTPRPWRWSTAGFAAVAAVLALYVALRPLPPAPSAVALLHAPQETAANWVATADRDGLRLLALAATAPPNGRAFELWAIAPGAKTPQPLGVIPREGVFRLKTLPAAVRQGATLAISVEPPGGSPTGQPTGPVVFVGALREM